MDVPRYTYKCPEHGEFDHEMPMAKRDDARCPICFKGVDRVFSPPRGDSAVLITQNFRNGFTDPEPEVY